MHASNLSHCLNNGSLKNGSLPPLQRDELQSPVVWVMVGRLDIRTRLLFGLAGRPALAPSWGGTSTYAYLKLRN